MIPTSSTTTGSTAPAPIELSDQEVAQLRRAARWARLVGIIGLVLWAMFVVMFVASKITHTAGELASVTYALYLALNMLGGAIAAAMLIGNGQNVLSFFRYGHPALAQAFRRLRLLLTLWTLLGAFDLLYDVVSLLGKL